MGISAIINKTTGRIVQYFMYSYDSTKDNIIAFSGDSGEPTVDCLLVAPGLNMLTSIKHMDVASCMEKKMRESCFWYQL